VWSLSKRYYKKPGISVLLVSILTFTHIKALVNAIFALAAYRYATDQQSDLFPGDGSYAEHAFIKTNKTTDTSGALTTVRRGRTGGA